MRIAIFIAAALAYLGIGVLGVAVGEVFLDSNPACREKDNPLRTVVVLLWPGALVLGIGLVIIVGVVEGLPTLYKRWVMPRLRVRLLLFFPGEAARRIACIVQSRKSSRVEIE